MRSWLVVCALLLAGCVQPPIDLPEAQEVVRSGHALEGIPAPDYAPEALVGDGPALEDLEGNVSLVFVWASWCTVCGRDEPKLVDLRNELDGTGFEILAVSHETSRDKAMQHATEGDWPFPSYHDEGVNAHFGLRDYQPNYLLVGPDGVIEWVHQGAMDMDVLRHNIGALSKP